MPDSSNSRPSSSGGGAAGSSGSSSDGGSESMSPDAVPGLAAQHDVESTIAPSAFATATATAAVTGVWAVLNLSQSVSVVGLKYQPSAGMFM
jgi:hypothetical protein